MSALMFDSVPTEPIAGLSADAHRIGLLAQTVYISARGPPH